MDYGGDMSHATMRKAIFISVPAVTGAAISQPSSIHEYFDAGNVARRYASLFSEL